MADFEDYYDILQVSSSVEPEVIKAAFKKLAQKYHPDVNTSQSTTEKMKRINIAHDILSNPSKRKEYDKEWQKHKVGDASPGEPSRSKTEQNNTHTERQKEDRSKPQGKSHERRIALIVLLIADIALLVTFLLVPWIRQAIAHYPWLKVTLLLLILAFACVAVGFQRFRRVLTNAIKSLPHVTRRWVTGGDPDKAPRDRIVIIILSIILIALLVLFLLIPWIRLIIVRYPWLKVVFWVLVAICLFGLFKSHSFRRGFYDLSRSIIVAIKSIFTWVTSRGSTEEADEPNIDKWTWQPINIVGKLELDVWDSILEFRSRRHYDYEDGYHKELYEHLKGKFPRTKLKPNKGASQIDIGIDNIGIEVKGPTRKGDLKDITDKVLRYTKHWSPIFVVLFCPKFGEGLTETYFLEIKDGIQRRHNDEVGVITKKPC